MEALDTPEQLREAETVAHRVFQSIGTGTRNPFREQIEARTLIYPIDYTMLDEGQFQAVGAAAASVGDQSAYLAPYGTLEAGWAGTYDHSLVALDSYSDYRPGGALILEHLLYSPHGTWGLVTSDDGEALVGGSQGFVKVLRDRLAEKEGVMVRAFVRDSKDMGRGGGNVEWLQPLLVHLYGKARAQRLWDEVNGGAVRD
jgi:hypothetical protein